MTAVNYSWTPGFYAGDRPKIVTERFEYEDSYTLDRYHATGGYDGLAPRWPSRPATSARWSRTPRCSATAAPGSPPA